VSPTVKARFKRRFLKLRPFKRHGVILMVAGFIYMAIGVSYIAAPTTEEVRHNLVIALIWFPLHFWGGVWFGVGLLALISSRWPPVFESWGYAVLTGTSGWLERNLLDGDHLQGDLINQPPIRRGLGPARLSLVGGEWVAEPGQGGGADAWNRRS
jgi:hypothetical protein